MLKGRKEKGKVALATVQTALIDKNHRMGKEIEDFLGTGQCLGQVQTMVVESYYIRRRHMIMAQQHGYTRICQKMTKSFM